MRELICGKNSVLDAIKNKLPIKVIYTTRPREISAFKNKKEVSKIFLDKLTNENHQGFVAKLEAFNYCDLKTIIKDQPKKIIILDHIQDSHNFGAILRNANAFGIKHIIIPRKRSVKINSAVIKTSSGGYVGIKITRVDSLMDAIVKLKKNCYWIYATGFKNSQDFQKVTYNYPLAIIFGNESKGVSQTLLKHADQIISVKTKGTVQSLNVAVASGIIIFGI